MILTRRFYMVLTLIILLMGSGYAFAPLFTIGQGVLFLLLLSVLADGYMLYRIRGIRAFRQCSARFSNGDENAVNLRVKAAIRIPSLRRLSMKYLSFFSREILVFGYSFRRMKENKSVIIYVRQAGGFMVSDRFAYS